MKQRSNKNQHSDTLLQFIDGVLHQLSQPVTGIHGFAQFLKSETDPQLPFYQPLSAIEEQSTILIRTLENVKELVQHRQIKITSVSAELPLKGAIGLCDDIFKKRGIDCVVVVAKNLPSIKVDPLHLEKIFLNILLNYIKLGGTKTNLKVTVEDNKQGSIRINFLSPFKESFMRDANFILDSKATGLRLYGDSIKLYKGKVACLFARPSSTQMTIVFPVA